MKFSRKDFVNRMKYEQGFGVRVMEVMQPYFDMLLGNKPKLNLADNEQDKVFDLAASDY